MIIRNNIRFSWALNNNCFPRESNCLVKHIKFCLYPGRIESPRRCNRLVKEFMHENAEVHYIDSEIFFACYSKIHPWLDFSLLAIHLTKYGIVKNSDDMSSLSGRFAYPQDKSISLVKLVEKAGPDGFMFLYMSLRESSVEHIGHQEAVKELDHCGK